MMTERTSAVTPLHSFRVSAAPSATLGTLEADGLTFPCAVGRSGIVADKREGDGGTPTGRFPLRDLRFRPDRLPAPVTQLPTFEIARTDGWCDAPDDPAYNTPVSLPYPASAEHMWREDHAYDLVVVIGYNDDPVAPGKGSAIFMHLVKELDGDFTPTAGCVALKLKDMLTLLPRLSPTTQIEIAAA